MKKIVLLFFIIVAAIQVHAQIIYVNANYTDTGLGSNGLSWDSPFTTIEDAIAASKEDSEIWIAAGAYISPDTITGIDSNPYVITHSLHFYGGFAGNETSKLERTFADTTIISSQWNDGTLRDCFQIDDDSLSLTMNSVKFTNVNNAIRNYDFDQNNLKILLENITGENYIISIIRTYASNSDIIIINSFFKNISHCSNSYSGNVSIFNCLFDSCSSYPIQKYEEGTTIIENCSFNNCFNLPDINDGDTFIRDCIFKNNTGYVEITGTNALISNCIFSGHKNSYIFSTTLTQGIQFLDCSFYSNTLGRMLQIGNDAEFSNCTFENNTIGESIYVYAAKHCTINNSKFLNNKLNSSTGLLNLSSNNISISNCIIENNKNVGTKLLNFYGDNTGTVSIDNSQFINDSVAAYWMQIENFQKTIISNSLFEKNISGNEIFNIYTNFEMSNCVVKENINNHGVLFRNIKRNYVYNNVLFENNYSYGSFFQVTSADFNNCIFNANDTYTIFTYNNLNLNNCLLYDNIGSSIITGIAQGAALNVANSIVWENTFTETLNSNLLGIIEYSDLQYDIPGEGNMNVDPHFLDAANGNFHLDCISPLINKGTNTGVSVQTDFEGNDRIMAGVVDMGVYESPYDPMQTAEPMPDFSVSNSNPCMTETVSFTNLTPYSETSSFIWKLGDESLPQFTKNANHAYSKAGTYTIELIATNICGLQNSISKTIEVNNNQNPQIFNITAVNPGDTTMFYTNAVCGTYNWLIDGGEIISGTGTDVIDVKWGSGENGNGTVQLDVANCDAGFCELSVHEEISIFPENFSILGENLVCMGSTRTYSISNTGAASSIYYSWNVVGGEIISSNNWYGITSVTVLWSDSEIDGEISLTTTNTLLSKIETQSLVVLVRPTILFKEDTIACVGTINDDYGSLLADPTNLQWTIDGTENVIDQNGFINWGSLAGVYTLNAQELNADDYCISSRSIAIHVYENPSITSLLGETKFTDGEAYEYIVTSNDPDAEILWSPLNGTLLEDKKDTAIISWKGAYSPQILQAVALSHGECSDTAKLTIEKDFELTITGANSVCYKTDEVFSVNRHPSEAHTYQWYVNDVLLPETDSFVIISQDAYAANNIRVETTILGKLYAATFIANTDFSSSSLKLSGVTTIDPEGTGTYVYKVEPYADPYTIDAVGAASINQTGDDISITWDGTGTYVLTVTPEPVGETCVSKPRVLNVKAISFISEPIYTLTGSNCINTEVTYAFRKDSYTSDNIQWNLSGGGVITETTKTTVTVRWGDVVGTYQLSATYERYGSRTANLAIELFNNPSPEINDIIICGSDSKRLTTTNAFTSYQWYKEPDGLYISGLKNPAVNEEGIYKVVVSDVHGCKGVGAKYIQQIPYPEPKIFAESGASFCVGTIPLQTVALKTIEGNYLSYIWYKEGVEIANSNSQYLTTSFDAQTSNIDNYTVKVTLFGCESLSPIKSLSTKTCDGGLNCTDPAVGFSISDCNPYVFENNDTGDGFYWTFGDGTTSEATNPPVVNYPSIGDYEVVLKKGCQESKKTVIIPAQSIFQLNTPACFGTELEFLDLSVNIPEYPITEWKWNFGDGSPELINTSISDRNAFHTFTQSGDFTVTLTIKALNANGTLCESTSTQEIHVTNPPSVDFTIQSPSCDNNLYSFTDISVIATEEASYNWNLDEGQSSSTKNAVVRYYSEGNKDVSLTVTDLWGCTNTSTQSFTFTSPIAREKISITGKDVLCNGNTITLTAPTSETTYEWYKDGIAQPETTNSISITTPGSYAVSVQKSGCVMLTDPTDIIAFSSGGILIGKEHACKGDELSYEIDGISSLRYNIEWQKDLVSLGNTSTLLTLNNISSTNDGEYSVIVTNKDNGCIDTLAPIVLTVHNYPNSPYITHYDNILCYNGAVSFTTGVFDPSYTCKWYENDVFTGDTTRTPTFDSLHTTSNFFMQVTDPVSTCSRNTNTIKIYVTEDFKIALGEDILECAATKLELSTGIDQSSYYYSYAFQNNWYKDGVKIQTVSDNTLFINSLSQADAGDYYVEVVIAGSYENCSSLSDTISIAMKPSPEQPEITGVDNFCEGDVITLSSSVTDNIQWNQGSTSASINVSESGNFKVTATEPSTLCSLSRAKTVQRNSAPNFSFIPIGTYEVCNTDYIKFEALKTFDTYQWFIDGEPFRAPNLDLWVAKPGKYTLKATTLQGCSGESDTLNLFPLSCYNTCIVYTAEDNVPGSLREAINCANATPGIDKIVFLIPELEAPYNFSFTSALPAITEGVIIDGYSQPGNDNGLLLMMDGSTYNEILFTVNNSVANVEIKGLVINDFQYPLYLKTGSVETIVENVLFNNYTNTGILLEGGSNSNTIRNCTFSGISSATSIKVGYNSFGNTIENNTFTSLQKTAISAQGAIKSINILSNVFENCTSTVIDISKGSEKTQIINNTIKNCDVTPIRVAKCVDLDIISNRIGSSTTTIGKDAIVVSQCPNASISNNTITTIQGAGIVADSLLTIQYNTISNCSNYAISVLKKSTILSNTLSNNILGGLYVEKDSVVISRNKITNTNESVKAIDLHGLANNNKQAALFDTYYQTSKGLMLKGHGTIGDIVQIFTNNNKAQQALAYVGQTTVDANGKWTLEITNTSYFNANAKNYYVNTATEKNNTSELSTPFMVGCFTCACVVENTNNTGANSLRAAVDSAHLGVCLQITFDLPPLSTIDLSTEIKPLTVPVSIVGPSFTSNPEIIIQGQGTDFGLQLDNDGIAVKNLQFTNWNTALAVNEAYANINNCVVSQTNEPLVINGDNNTVSNNCFNCNNTDPNFTVVNGITITGNNNKIGTLNNGNTVNDCSSHGILVNGGLGNSLLYNSLLETTLPINHENDGNNNYAAPTNLTGKQDGMVASISGTANPGDKIQVFSSTYYGDEAIEYVTEITASSTEWTINIPAAFIKNDANTFFVLTATSKDGSTSKLSDVVKVGDFVMYCYVTNTDNAGKGSLRDAVVCANSAGKGNGVPAIIVFQLPNESNVIDVLGEGFSITNNFGVTIDPESIDVSIQTSDNVTNAFTWQTQKLAIKNLKFKNFDVALKGVGDIAKTNLIQDNLFEGNDTAIFISGKKITDNISITGNTITSASVGMYISNMTASVSSNNFAVNATDKIEGVAILADNIWNSTISNNTIDNIYKSQTDTLPGNSIIIKNSHDISISNNSISTKETASPAIAFYNVTQSNISKNNISDGETGVLAKASRNITLTSNEFTGISKSGIALENTDSTIISQNLATGFLLGSKPINLNYTQVTESNAGKQAPVFDYATYKNGNLIIRGFAPEGDKVEMFLTDENGNDLTKYLGTVTSDRFGKFEFWYPVNIHEVNDFNFRATTSKYDYYKGKKTYTSEASVLFNPQIKICWVLSNSDENIEGTLRYNIGLANNDECNLMLFDIAETSKIIEPQTELPEITAKLLTIDATSQFGYSFMNPIVELADAGFNNALKVNTDGIIAVHGILFNGYSKPVLISNVRDFENTVSSFVDFDINTHDIISKKHESIRVDSCFISSPYATTAFKSDQSNIYLANSTINAGTDTAIVISADSIVILNNKIKLNEPDIDNNSFAISLSNIADSAYVSLNRIDGYKNGIIIRDAYSAIIRNNIINKDTIMLINKGIVAQNADSCMFVSNEIYRSDTAVSIRVSEKLSFAASKIDSCLTIGIMVYNSDSVYLTSNFIANIPKGIEIRNSKYNILTANMIQVYNLHGIELPIGSDSTELHGNYIGGFFTSSKYLNEGMGLSIKSSYNTIGGSKDKGNYVFNNAQGGIEVRGGTDNNITYNLIFNNDTIDTRPSHYAIKHEEYGNMEKLKPIIKGYETIKKDKSYRIFGTSEPKDSIHVYRSEGYYQNARYFVDATKADSLGNWEMYIDTSNTYQFDRQFPLRKNTLTLVATATDSVYHNTSELSDILYVGTCYVTNARDNDDNEYPVPNSFRQAVTCANSVDEYAYIRINIAGNSLQKVIPVRIKMIDMVNSYGLDLYGLNNVDHKPILFNNAPIDPKLNVNTFWKLTDSLDSLKISNIDFINYDTTMRIEVASKVELSKIDCKYIGKTAFSFAEGVEDYILSNLTFSQSPNATFISLDSTQSKFTIENSKFDQGERGIYISGADSVTIQNNEFIRCKTLLDINASTKIACIHNTLKVQDSITGIHWNNVEGTLVDNIFVTEKFTQPLIIESSKNTKLEKNSFNGVCDTCIYIASSDSITMTSNTIAQARFAGILFEDSKSSFILKNKINKVDSVGIELVNSHFIKMSKNTIIGFKEKDDENDSLMAINLNLTDDLKFSNNRKPDPIILGYKIHRVPGDCKSDATRFGLYLYGTAAPNDSIEVYFTDSLATTLKRYVLTDTANSKGEWQIRIPKKDYIDEFEDWYHFTVTASDMLNNTSQTAVALHFGDLYNRISVQVEDNDGPFSLREAIYNINCSDVRSKVFFELDNSLQPYEIVLTDTLPHIKAFLGFEMDGYTQYDFAIKDNPDPLPLVAQEMVTINAEAVARDSAVFFIDSTTFKSEIVNLSFKNSANVLRMENSTNTLKNLNFACEPKGDTAINSSKYGGHSISSCIIDGYQTGIYMHNGASGNSITSDTLRNVDIAIRLKSGSQSNVVKKNIFAFDSVGIFIDHIQKVNTITENVFGTIETPVSGPSILIDSSQSQYITDNEFLYATKPRADSITAFILVKGASEGITITGNFIGIDKKREYHDNPSSLRGIWFKADKADEFTSNNLISDNEIVGLTNEAIVLENTKAGFVTTNYIGVDKIYNTKGDVEDYSLVPGIGNNAIAIYNSSFVTINSNIIINYLAYGLDINNSTDMTMERNRIFSERSTNKAINLHLGVAEESNYGIIAPIIDTAIVFSLKTLRLKGSSNFPNSFIQLYEAFDKGDQSFYYMDNVATDANGEWSIDLPTENFGFSKYSKFVAQVTNNGNSSEYSSIYRTQPLLCKLKEFNLDLIEDEYTPCPKSKFEIDAQLDGLHYAWISKEAYFETIDTRVAQIDTSSTVTLNITDDFGCLHTETFKVSYKPLPQEPEFIVASQNYVDDTIVLIDVSYNQPESYEWFSSPGVAIVSTSEVQNITGKDGKLYPTGREVRFMVPDSGVFVMRQTSLLNGCFNELSKEVSASYKDNTIPDPYTLTPNFNSVSVYPSPIGLGERTDAYIKTGNKNKISVSIIDMDGEIIYTQSFSGKTNYVISLPSDEITTIGIYIVSVTTDTGIYSYKIVIKENAD